jgi:YHS domain-containing protein
MHKELTGLTQQGGVRMDKKLMVLAMAFMLMGGQVFAQDAASDEPMKDDAAAMNAAASNATMDADVSAGMDDQAAPEEAAAIEVNNTVDPMTGEAITADNEMKVEYKGKIYNFTQKGKDWFEKNPAEGETKLNAMTAPAAEGQAPAAAAEDAGAANADGEDVDVAEDAAGDAEAGDNAAAPAANATKY